MQLPIKPLSVNSKFTINKYSRRIVKSTNAVKFERNTLKLLSKYDKDIKNFSSKFDKNKDALTLELVIYVPATEFFTKKGAISATCIDVSNTLKIIEDTIYKALAINDSFNIKVSAEKRPYNGTEWITHVEIIKTNKPRIDPLDAITWGPSLPS